MKLIIRSAFALVFLIGLATPLLAQNPDVAVRIRPLRGNCFRVDLKNMRNAPVNIFRADMIVFDKNCRQICSARDTLGRRLDPCSSLNFSMCCDRRPPPGSICYVRVRHTNGNTMNEGWFFVGP